MPPISEVITKVKSLGDREKECMLFVLQNIGLNFTKNSNGYFFDLNKVSEETLNHINEKVDYILDNRKFINGINQEREEIMQHYKSIISQENEKKKKDLYNEALESLIIKENPDCDYYVKKIKKEYTQDPEKYKGIIPKNSIYFKITQRMHRNKRKWAKPCESVSESAKDPETKKSTVEYQDSFSQQSDLESNSDKNSETESDTHSESECEIVPFEEKMAFYKSLLSKDYNYVFDYDKDVKMSFQEYI